jgi:hypothetical protein
LPEDPVESVSSTPSEAGSASTSTEAASTASLEGSAASSTPSEASSDLSEASSSTPEVASSTEEVIESSSSTEEQTQIETDPSSQQLDLPEQEASSIEEVSFGHQILDFIDSVYTAVVDSLSHAVEFVIRQLVPTAYAAAVELYDTPLFPDGNLVSYWRMENNSNDAKGSNNGTDTSMSYTTSSGAFGYGGSYNGTSSSQRFAGPAFGSAATISLWMKTNFNNTTDSSQRIFIDTTSPRQFLFYYEGAYKKFGWNSGGANVIDPFTYSFGNISGQWHHWAFVWTTTTNWKVYFDGAVIQSGTTTITTGTPTSLTMGAKSDQAHSWAPAAMDDVAYFNRALTADEVYDLYAGLWPSTIQDLNYTYDANNNLTQISDISDSDTAKTTYFTYDSLNRLVTASSTNAATSTNYYHQYAYDGIGNITSSTPSGVYGYTTTTTGYVNPHAAIAVGTSTYIYDTNGAPEKGTTTVSLTC